MSLTRCWASEVIAAHCNQDESEYCYNCGELIAEDDNNTEIKNRDGYNFVCDDCVEDFTDMVVQ
jgi:hypothetical protein